MLPESIEVACRNSKTSCTISGPSEDVHRFVAKLKEKGIFAKAVNVSNIAYHSQYIAPAGPKLLNLLRDVLPEPRPRSARWVSEDCSKYLVRSVKILSTASPNVNVDLRMEILVSS